MIIKKSAGLMTRGEAEQLAEACDIYMVKGIRLANVADKLTNLGFFDGIAQAMENFGDIVGDSKYERILLDSEKTPNRALEFYTINPQDYNWIIDAHNKLGHKLSIIQVVELGTEFNLDNLIALVPIKTGLGEMSPVFKKSVITSFIGKGQGRDYIYAVNRGEIKFISGVGPFSTAIYSLNEGKLYGGYDFKKLLTEGENIIKELKPSVDIGFVANTRVANTDKYFKRGKSAPRSESAMVIDLSSLNESLYRERSLKLNLNYDFLDKYFTPQLKKQMVRKIRKFIIRRGGLPKSKQSGADPYADMHEYIKTKLIQEVPPSELPYVVFASYKGTFEGSRIQEFLEKLNNIELDETPYSLSEEIEQEIVSKLEKGLSTYYENNGLTRPISTLSGSPNKFRGRVIRSIIEDAIASSLPGFSQPTGKQRGFRLEKSYTGMPVTLKDLSSTSSFNDVLTVMGEIPLYTNKDKKMKLYQEALENALNEMTKYFETNFKQFVDIKDSYDFRIRVESSIKKISSGKLNFILKLTDSSQVDIGMSVIFIFKFTLPDFSSKQTSYLTLEEVDVERYFSKTSQGKYTVDVNKIEDLNLEMADTVRRVYEVKPFFSSGEGLQAKDPEGKRTTTPMQTSKGFLTSIFKQQAAKEGVVVIKDLAIDNLTGRIIGVLFYPGISGGGVYVSVDDRKSGLVRTRTNVGEIFVVCSGQIVFKTRRDGSVSFRDPAVSESVCSMGRGKEDFMANFDSAATPFMATGSVRPKKLDSINFDSNISKPGDMAHINVGAGHEITQLYNLVVESGNSNPDITGAPAGSEILISSNEYEELLNTTMRNYSDTDKENVSALSLSYMGNVYQEYFQISITAHFRRGDDGGYTSQITGALAGDLDSGVFYPSGREENLPNLEKIFNTNSIKTTVIEDFKRRIKQNESGLKAYLEGGGKDSLYYMIKQKAFGHELGQTPTKGTELAETRFRRLTDE